MIKFFNILLWLLLISSHIIKAQSDKIINIEQNRKVNICKYRGDEIIITVDVGTITKEDKFFGYELGLSFDNTKIVLDKFLFNGTLTEFFETDKRGMNVITENDKSTLDVFGVTFSLNNSIYGNRPLIAFGGRYIGECPDSSLVKIEWLEFTSEFTGRFIDTNNLYVVSEFIEDSTKKLDVSMRSTTDSALAKDSTLNLIVNAKQSSQDLIRKFEFNFKLNENFKIVKIEQLNDNMIYQLVEDDNHNFKIMIENSEFIDTDILSVEIQNISDLEYHEGAAEINIVPIDTCSCIQVGDLDEIVILGKNEIINSVKANNQYFELKNKVIYLKDNSYKTIIIYDYLGRKIAEYKEYDKAIFLDDFKSGIYFIELINYYEHKLEKIILN